VQHPSLAADEQDRAGNPFGADLLLDNRVEDVRAGPPLLRRGRLRGKRQQRGETDPPRAA
jgi:hypothetical protein